MITLKKKLERKPWPTFSFLVFVLAAGLGILGFLIFSNWRINQKRTALNNQVKYLTEELEFLEEKNEKLRNELSKIGSSEYLEKIGREELNLKNPGEEVVTIIKKEEAKAEKQEEKNFWEKLLERLGFLTYPSQAP